MIMINELKTNYCGLFPVLSGWTWKYISASVHKRELQNRNT